eukprot:TRINITY_DN186_c0_g1_i5.p1 TRINITY_DN186_c0_g1~~TRINITY_DN186_c0_g1_i5.p1  ORF type:complete len:413 (+),score=135.43 TRINITY_DN186_c0_g1_i5:57-1295(+)
MTTKNPTKSIPRKNGNLSTSNDGENTQNGKVKLGECAYDFDAISDSELNLKQGDLIEITDRSDPEWWYGTCKRTGDSGYFPKNYVKKHRPDQNGSNKTNLTTSTPTNPNKLPSNNTNNKEVSSPMNSPNNSSNNLLSLTQSGPLKNSQLGTCENGTKTKLKMNLVALPKNNDKAVKSPRTKGLLDKIFGGKKKKKGEMSISSPFNLEHHVHVDFDSETGFAGLPSEWEHMIKSSGFTKEEVVENADVMYAVLEFTNEYQKQNGKEKMPELPNMKPKTNNNNNNDSPSVNEKVHTEKPPVQETSNKPSVNNPNTNPTTNPTPTPKPKLVSEEKSEEEDPNVPERQDYVIHDIISSEDPKKRFLNLEKIGEGAAGEVFIATDSKTKEQIAIKKNQIERTKLEIDHNGSCHHEGL